MDQFTFVTEVSGGNGWDNFTKFRNVVRAHVMRKHWKEVKDVKTLDSPFGGLDSSPSSSSELDRERSPQTCCKSTSTRALNIHHKRKKALLNFTNRPLLPRVSGEKLCRSFGKSSDPFIYAGSYIDPGSTHLFQHYNAEFKLILSNTIQPLKMDGPALCCTEAIQNRSPALLHAICFQAAAYLAVVGTPRPLRQTLFKYQRAPEGAEKDTLYHRVATLSTLRSLLSSGESHPFVLRTSILCVAILLAAEAMMGTFDGLESHTQGLQRLVTVFGGIHALPASMISQVQLADVKAATAQRRLPSFKLEPYIMQHAQQRARLLVPTTIGESSTTNFGLSFTKPYLLTRLCPALLQCISHAKSLTLVNSNSSGGNQFTSSLKIDDFILLDHSLLSLRDHQTLSTLEECVRLALLLFSNTALWQIPPYFNWVISLVTELKSTLLLTGRHSMINEQQELFLWVSLLGLYAVPKSNAADRRWWSHRVREFAARLNLTSWKDAREVVSTFAYIDKIYGSAWEEMWNAAVLIKGP